MIYCRSSSWLLKGSRHRVKVFSEAHFHHVFHINFNSQQCSLTTTWEMYQNNGWKRQAGFQCHFWICMFVWWLKMWVYPNSADHWERGQTLSRNTGALSPRSQRRVIWPLNICWILTDLCSAKRDVQNALCYCLAAKNISPLVYCQRERLSVEGNNVD